MANLDNSIIFTVGYEGLSLEQLIAKLLKNGVQILGDARYRPHSRKRGFSKKKFSDALLSHGIHYQHEIDLGTPPSMMAEVRRTGQYDFDKYRSHLRVKRKTLSRIATLALEEKICLLCYEADHRDCHRLIVAEELSAISGALIVHL